MSPTNLHGSAEAPALVVAAASAALPLAAQAKEFLRSSEGRRPRSGLRGRRSQCSLGGAPSKSPRRSLSGGARSASGSRKGSRCIVPGSLGCIVPAEVVCAALPKAQLGLATAEVPLCAELPGFVEDPAVEAEANQSLTAPCSLCPPSMTIEEDGGAAAPASLSAAALSLGRTLEVSKSRGSGYSACKGALVFVGPRPSSSGSHSRPLSTRPKLELPESGTQQLGGACNAAVGGGQPGCQDVPSAESAETASSSSTAGTPAAAQRGGGGYSSASTSCLTSVASETQQSSSSSNTSSWASSASSWASRPLSASRDLKAQAASSLRAAFGRRPSSGSTSLGQRLQLQSMHSGDLQAGQPQQQGAVSSRQGQRPPAAAAHRLVSALLPSCREEAPVSRSPGKTSRPGSSSTLQQEVSAEDALPSRATSTVSGDQAGHIAGAGADGATSRASRSGSTSAEVDRLIARCMTQERPAALVQASAALLDAAALQLGGEQELQACAEGGEKKSEKIRRMLRLTDELRRYNADLTAHPEQAA
eukprot:TRINITY_DN29494_c0_g1_i1.p1 TRINITY_DN29494_c0_g1~~TRINITY_DN29494_c0_g1_i1.p1  ORF type:complete len:533 (-),score=108.51 TRINITY_DN29494_c0_g1_i1:81-1679(-)